MAALGAGFPVELRRRYPHLMPEDKVLWERWIVRGDDLPARVWYDVRVGHAVEVESGQPEWMKHFAEYATRKRIDIVGAYGNDYVVFEAKPFAGMVALGQLVFYRWAFAREYGGGRRVFGGVITDVVDPDVAPIFAGLGIWVVEVGLGGQL